jgi:hypothetical protein
VLLVSGGLAGGGVPCTGPSKISPEMSEKNKEAQEAVGSGVLRKSAVQAGWIQSCAGQRQDAARQVGRVPWLRGFSRQVKVCGLDVFFMSLSSQHSL